MKLGDWLTANKMTYSAFASLVGIDESHVSRLVEKNGKKQVRKPSFDLASRISLATNGAVTANDFMDQPVDGAVDNSTGNGRAA